MALPELDMAEDLEAEDEEAPLDGEDELEANGDGDVDPMFAADVAEAFPKLTDSQIAALQRAILGLTAASAAPPMGGDPMAPPMF